MTAELQKLRDLLQQHYDEAASGLVEKSPSELSRGEGTEKSFFILKIDLVGSTVLLRSARKSTYLKLAHTYLSTIDKITQKFGADPAQVEYAGDSVLAYFSETKATAEDVLVAACHARAAVDQIKELKGTLNGLELRCKIVLHYDALIVSKIGPRANSMQTAIGWPLHHVSKLEKETSPGVIFITEKFQRKINLKNRHFLIPMYFENEALTPSVSLTAPTGLFAPLSGRGLFQNKLLVPTPQLARPIGVVREIRGYKVNWLKIATHLNLR
jgi:class 3 adenylate cyclase